MVEQQREEEVAVQQKTLGGGVGLLQSKATREEVHRFDAFDYTRSSLNS